MGTLFEKWILPWQGLQLVKEIIVFEEQGLVVFSYPENIINSEGRAGVLLEAFRSLRNLYKKASPNKVRIVSLYCGRDQVNVIRLKPVYMAVINDVKQKLNIERHFSTLLLDLKNAINARYAGLVAART